MKGKFSLYVCAFCSIFPMYFTISWTLYSTGSWCPYQVEKIVPCRVRNGTEPYYGTNICWRNENGSYACTKKLMYRPKYTTTYKKIMETKYACCAGRDGPNCEKECFNCTSFRKLEDRLATQERRLGRLEKSIFLQKSAATAAAAAAGGSDRYHKDLSSENSVYSAVTPPPAPSFAQDGERFPEGQVPGSALSLAQATLNLRVQTILDEFREMQNRIRYLENEVTRLNTQVEDLSVGSNVAYDYSGGSSSSGTTSNSLHLNKDTRNSRVASSSTSATSKDSPSPTILPKEMTSDDGRNNNETGDKSAVSSHHHEHQMHHYRHPHSHHQHHHQHHSHHHQTHETFMPSSSSPPPPHHHFNHHHSSVKSDSTPFRVLEENLERGDIASTLNDDYGDDLYNDNSTEQYIDQLQAKREQHLP